MSKPIISWRSLENKVGDEITEAVKWGVVDAETDSSEKVFHIWNNYNGTEDVPTMEDVTFTTRDKDGGLGNNPDNVVEAVRDNWFRVRVDSLEETSFTQVGSGLGNTNNPTGVKALGTNGETINPKVSRAVTWKANTALTVGDIIKPVADNKYIYEVVVEGTTGTTEPIWATTEGSTVTDGSVQYKATPQKKKPATQEILGVANNVAPDGSNVSDAGGNFATITMYASVPGNASNGKNAHIMRVSYRYV